MNSEQRWHAQKVWYSLTRVTPPTTKTRAAEAGVVPPPWGALPPINTHAPARGVYHSKEARYLAAHTIMVPTKHCHANPHAHPHSPAHAPQNSPAETAETALTCDAQRRANLDMGRRTGRAANATGVRPRGQEQFAKTKKRQPGSVSSFAYHVLFANHPPTHRIMLLFRVCVSMCVCPPSKIPPVPVSRHQHVCAHALFVRGLTERERETLCPCRAI
jgi:hypothetical protein